MFVIFGQDGGADVRFFHIHDYATIGQSHGVNVVKTLILSRFCQDFVKILF